MAPNTILAVAVGEKSTVTHIKSVSHTSGVRPYIDGLIFGLSLNGYELPTSYVIEYHHCPASKLDAFFKSKVKKLRAKDVVFCMSTGVVEAASKNIKKNAIVGVISDHQKYAGTNVCGYSAKRVQQAPTCYQNFLLTVPGLTDVWVLHQRHYGPAKTALDLIERSIGKKLSVVDVTEGNEIRKELNKVPKGAGVLVLPIDRCFGNADEIITCQNKFKIPIFWPATDWVNARKTAALGGYGVPQEYCGYRMGEQIAFIWSNDGAIPPFEDCQDSHIKWLASRKAAAALGFVLGAHQGLQKI